MKVLGIVPSIYDTSPGQRFRIEQWEPLLREKGVQIDYAPFESDSLHKILYKEGATLHKSYLLLSSLLKRLKSVTSAKKYDLVYIFREAALLGPAFFETLLKKYKVPTVFDFDDAIFLPNVSSANAKFGFLKSPKKTGRICQLVNHVIAGNSFLADYAGQFNSNITIIPTSIDTDKYTLFPQTSFSNQLSIVWSGSHSTVQHLDTLRPALQKLAKEENFKLHVIGTPSYELDGVSVEAKQWNAETEVTDLQNNHIGIMPLIDDEWSKGKCGLKALQYMALGIPTICSPIGVNTDIIQDGKNGFLANTEVEWIDKLEQLLRSPELRRQLGNNGRQTVEQKYSAKVQAPRVLETFTEIINRNN